MTVSPRGRLQEKVSLKQLADMSLDAASERMLSASTTLTIRGQLESVPGVRRPFSGQSKEQPWSSYYPELVAVRPSQKGMPEPFKNGWPSWAWKGKLVSNSLVLKVTSPGS